MKLLLDTHVFLWWILDAPNLSAQAREMCEDGNNQLMLSVGSAWEIAIKSNLGKISLPDSMEKFLPAELEKNAIELLTINLAHVMHIEKLPKHHRDPLDRLLVAQAQVEKIPILSCDSFIQRYEVETIW